MCVSDLCFPLPLSVTLKSSNEKDLHRILLKSENARRTPTYAGDVPAAFGVWKSRGGGVRRRRTILQKKREYNWRIMNVDNGTFTSLIYSIDGRVGRECGNFYSHLCSKIAHKNNKKFSDVKSWVRCKVSFLCLKNSLMSIRGTRAIKSSSNEFVSYDFKFDMLKCRINN